MPTLITIDKYLYRAPFHLDAIGVDLPELDEMHENRVPFHGILTRLDEPSTRPPNGAKSEDGKSHRVLIPRAVAEAALPSLIGMPIDSSLRLDNHDKKNIVGTITRAEIQGKDLVVTGYLFGKNQLEDVEEIKRNKANLGMSYEIGSVLVDDPDADVWTLTSLQFTGAAILLKSAAAYSKTAIAAQAEEESQMALEDLTKQLNDVGRKVSVLFAARYDEDEEDAKRHEEDAKRHEEDAKRARDDDDEDAAAKHDEDAAKAWIMAMRKHEEMAKKYDEDAKKEEDEDAKAQLLAAWKKHDEDAKRIKDEDAKRMKDEDGKHRDENAAKQKDGDEEMARMGMLMSMFLRGMGYKHDEDAKRHDEDGKRGDEDAFMPLMRAMLRSMAYPTAAPSARRKKADAAHDDEAEDTALFKRLMQQQHASVNASRAPVVDIEMKRRLRNLEASMEMLTDNVNKTLGLLTDVVTKNRRLATDGNQGTNGGTVAQRKTMHAAGEYWMSKDDARHNGEGKMTPEEAEKACAGLSVRDAMAKKFELMAAGRL